MTLTLTWILSVFPCSQMTPLSCPLACRLIPVVLLMVLTNLPPNYCAIMLMLVASWLLFNWPHLGMFFTLIKVICANAPSTNRWLFGNPYFLAGVKGEQWEDSLDATSQSNQCQKNCCLKGPLFRWEMQQYLKAMSSKSATMFTPLSIYIYEFGNQVTKQRNCQQVIVGSREFQLAWMLFNLYSTFCNITAFVFKLISCGIYLFCVFHLCTFTAFKSSRISGYDYHGYINQWIIYFKLCL